MKKIVLNILSLFIIVSTYAYEVNGVATNSETGDPLTGFDILLTYPGGGVAGSAVTGPNGNFTIDGIPDGTYYLESYSYPDPIVISGDYFMNTEYEDQITVNGSNVNNIDFTIPPHHPDFTLTGNLYDAVTNELITVQDFQVQAKLKYYVEFFTDYATDNGTYIIEDMPDWTYELSIFENEYYEGLTTEITIDSMGPDTVQMDFYLQPKSGVTVSGVLLDSITNEPIMQAGRTIQLQTVNSIFTETDSNGVFTFINIPPGIYSALKVRSEDTSYVNTTLSEISGFTVPDTGISNVELFQKPWVSIHEVTADNLEFEPGETKTVRFSITNDDLSYGSIWGVNLIFPDGVTVLDVTPFYGYANNDEVFETLPDCSTGDIKAWEGWHYVGIPPFASSEGNLEVLNESAWADVTLQFADDTTMATAPVFYEIYYEKHCFTIQPFSFGYIMMENGDLFTGEPEISSLKNHIVSYPNPAGDHATFNVSLDQARKGEIEVCNLSGQSVIKTGNRIFSKGNNELNVNTNGLKEGVYFYTFMAKDMKLTGKLIIAR